MRVLLDTNVLIRLLNTDEPYHEAARLAVSTQIDAGASCVLVPQVLYETWTTATRTEAANGLGREPAEVHGFLESQIANFTLLSDPPALYRYWLDLMRDYDVRG